MHYKSSLLGGLYYFWYNNECSNEESVDREIDYEKYILQNCLNSKRLKIGAKKEELKVVLKY
jgi:hypothetical protein